MAGHGRGLRGVDEAARSSVDSGRFGRMFRSLPAARHRATALHRLAETMIDDSTDDEPITVAEPEDENPTITAGFTYFGQFVDHDITFDPVSSLTAMNDPDALKDFRTPRLDLDSVYGRGKDDQPYLYQHADPLKLLLGVDRHPPSVTAPRPDLPRNAEDVALIGDPRNDENVIVGQLQSLFLRFHNRIVDHVVAAGTDPHDAFAEAQRLVRWHYQWLVVHEFLPRIVGDAMVAAVLPGTGPPHLGVLQASERGLHARRVLGGRLPLRPLDGPPLVLAQRRCAEGHRPGQAPGTDLLQRSRGRATTCGASSRSRSRGASTGASSSTVCRGHLISTRRRVPPTRRLRATRCSSLSPATASTPCSSIR